MRPIRCAAVLLVASAVQVQAQQDLCRPGAASNEAQALAYYTLPVSDIGPQLRAPGGSRLTVGVEATAVPELSATLATPTICRPGKGPENTDLLPVAGRLRAALQLGGGWTLGASWIPPVRLDGTRANVIGASLAWERPLGPLWSLALAAHGSTGTVRAPITCDDRALQDPISECFQGTRSNDRFTPTTLGLQGTASVQATPRLRLLAGAGWSHLRPRFQVNFVNRVGNIDSTRVEVNLNRLTAHAGVQLDAGARWGVALLAVSQPSDLVTARLVVSRGVGR